MIDFKLASDLKDAGFPFKKRGYRTGKTKIDSWYDGEYEYEIPTLSELIEECGDGFGNLGQLEPSKWAAWTRGEVEKAQHGKTPDIAVSKLYLALKKKCPNK